LTTSPAPADAGRWLVSPEAADRRGQEGPLASSVSQEAARLMGLRKPTSCRRATTTPTTSPATALPSRSFATWPPRSSNLSPKPPAEPTRRRSPPSERGPEPLADALGAFAEQHGIKSKGALCLPLVVTDHARTMACRWTQTGCARTRRARFWVWARQSAADPGPSRHRPRPGGGGGPHQPRVVGQDERLCGVPERPKPRRRARPRQRRSLWIARVRSSSPPSRSCCG